MSFQLVLQFIVDQPWKYVFSEKIETAQNSHILSSRNMWRRDWLLYKPLILRADCFGELDYSSMKIKSWWCACPASAHATLWSLAQSTPLLIRTSLSKRPWYLQSLKGCSHLKLPTFEIKIHAIIASTTCCWLLFGTSSSQLWNYFSPHVMRHRAHVAVEIS